MDSSTHAETIHEPPSEESLQAGHEVRDVNIRVLLWLGAAVFGVVAVVIAALFLYTNRLESAAAQADPELSPLAETERVTAAPRLQSTPVHDYLEYRRQQEETLNSYGWVDRENEVVRVPVSRAMELILKEGWPEPAEKPAAQDNDAETETPDGETD